MCSKPLNRSACECQSVTRRQIGERLCSQQASLVAAVSARIGNGSVSLHNRERTGKNIDSRPKTGRFRRFRRSSSINKALISEGYAPQNAVSLLFAVTGYLIAITGSPIAHNRLFNRP